MSVDKTIISIPSLYFYQYAPNTAGNVSELTYNEGIYLKSDSLNKAYPKSVVRVYKNPNNPKKLYLLSKDTSILQSIGKRFQSDAITLTVEDVYQYSYVNPYFSNDVGELQKYSIFQQPENMVNLFLNETSLTGKTINFYNLSITEFVNISKSLSGPSVSDDIQTNGLIRNVTPDSTIDDLTYSYILKSKSIITDYKNDKSTYLEKQVSIFNYGLYQYWSESGSINSLNSLTEEQVNLFKTSKIVNTKNIDFSSFIDSTNNGIWIQKIENDINYAGPNSVDNSYVISSYDDHDPENITWNTLRYNPTYNSLPDGNFIDYLVGKKLVVIKKDHVMGDYLNTRQVFNIPGSQPQNAFKPYRIIGSTTEVTGAFTQNTYDIFDVEYKLNLTSSNYKNIYDYGESNRNYQISELNNDDLSNMFILNDDFQYSSYGFVPDDLNSIVYEIEIENDVDIENGSFMVVEIE